MELNGKCKKTTPLCAYASFSIKVLLENLLLELKGIKTEEDTEFIHKSRVSSRRLRVAISMFSTCFNETTFSIFKKSIREIANSLGVARDLDVQIDFLSSIINENNEEYRVGLLYLLSSIKKQRKNIQSKLNYDIKKFLHKGTFNSMITEFQDKDRKLSKEENMSIRIHSNLQIFDVLNDLIELSYCLQDPNAVNDHHQMRLAAKKLRYRMEIYQRVYDESYFDFIQKIIMIQDKLGEIHDMDVIINYVLETLENQAISISLMITESLKKFHKHLKKKRFILFNEFIKIWSNFEEERFFTDARNIQAYSQ